MSLPPPSQLGLPPHFAAWYPNQQEVIAQALAAPQRFVGINAPTGAGKSVLAEVIAQFVGGRSCYLVMTKPLADQISDPERGIPYRYDVRGRSNYDCRLLADHGVFGIAAKADKAEALCESCQYKDNVCGYYGAIRQAGTAQHPLTNYDFWLSINEYRESGIGAFDLLICDEAHDIYKKLAAFMRIELDGEAVQRHIKRALPATQSPAKWREWATAHYPDVAMRLDMMQQAVKNGSAHPTRELSEMKRLATELEHLTRINDDWVEDRVALSSTAFEPVDVAPYAAKLFRSVPKVVLMSAMLRSKHFADLGIAAGDYTLIEAPSSFAVARRPVIHVKTVQQKEGMSDAARKFAVQRLDAIIASRLQTKGLVHTVSFDRSQYIQLHSAYSEYMLLNDSKSTAGVVVEHKRREPPSILVSPSIMTGYNFEDGAARWQVIFKMPFPYGGSAITKARKRRDPDSGLFATIVDFIQACGRIVRSGADWGETLVIDNNVVWFYIECLRKGWVPPWFQPAVRLNQIVIPPPLSL